MKWKGIWKEALIALSILRRRLSERTEENHKYLNKEMRYEGRYWNRWSPGYKPGALPLDRTVLFPIIRYSLSSDNSTLYSIGLNKLQPATHPLPPTLICSFGPNGPVSVQCRTIGFIRLKLRVPLRCRKRRGKMEGYASGLSADVQFERWRIVRKVMYSLSDGIQFHQWWEIWAVTYSLCSDVQLERWCTVWAVT
jgi:hypothetical protein